MKTKRFLEELEIIYNNINCKNIDRINIQIDDNIYENCNYLIYKNRFHHIEISDVGLNQINESLEERLCRSIALTNFINNDSIYINLNSHFFDFNFEFIVKNNIITFIFFLKDLYYHL